MDTPAVPTAAPTAAPRAARSGHAPGEAGHEPPSDLLCSARGCRAHADFGLRWNNPSLHTPDRRKTWLACTAHREHLSQFLGARGFLREVVAAADLPT
ncbi:hypothetical protein [Kineococcus sp. SYSU DK006]|uniref:hypothetical protein n=1 Tax=Kineococcus sp. SYSU DK006 TaxID=3383127 RepID=UPI003D7E00C8